jgi:structural maintenance of chromosome 4
MEIEGFDTSRKELTKLIPELRTKVELKPEDKAKLKELQKNVDKCKADMVSCQELATKLEAEVAKLQQAILDAGGTKLKKQQAACEKVMKELNDAEKALNTAKVAITSSQKASVKAKKQQEAAQKQLDDCEKLLEGKQAEFKELEGNAVEVFQSYEKVKVVEAEKRQELEAATKECDDLKKSHAEARCTEIELLGQVESYDRQLSESEKKKKHFEGKISDLLSAEEEDDNYEFSDDEGDVEMKESNDKSSGDRQEKSKEKRPAKTPSKSSLPALPFSALEKYNVDDIMGDIEHLQSERNTLAKNANMGAIEEYRKKEADYLARYGINLLFILGCVALIAVANYLFAHLLFVLQGRRAR